jgi:membrane fusion protein, heavy metal efflux system
MSNFMNTYTRFATLLACILALNACGKSDKAESEASSTHESGEKKGGHAEEESEGHVELNEKAALAAGIELAIVDTVSIREVITLYGTVQPNAERVREITARYPGVISSITKKVGDNVQQGEILATVESDESLRSYNVMSTLSGVVIARKANPGEKASDTSLLTVADLSTVWVELALFPRDLAKVHVGQSVRVKSVDEGVTTEGKIVYIASLGQSSTQTLTARVLLDNRDKRLAPGLYVVGDVVLSEQRVPLAVKSSALQSVENRSVVFVQAGDGFQATPVEIGHSDGEYTEIISGLESGSRYAAANSFVLKSELGKGEAGHDH